MVMLDFHKCGTGEIEEMFSDPYKLTSVSSKNDILRQLYPGIRPKIKTHGFEKLLAFNYEAYKNILSDKYRRLESSLDGIEVSVGVISFQGEIICLPITEIVTHNDFFDYDAKYKGKSSEITPARISNQMRSLVTKESLKIYKSMGLKGLSRSEFIFKNKVPYLLEVNTVPGLTKKSILPSLSYYY